jgi:hypothetical protein
MLPATLSPAAATTTRAAYAGQEHYAFWARLRGAGLLGGSGAAGAGDRAYVDLWHVATPKSALNPR